MPACYLPANKDDLGIRRPDAWDLILEALLLSWQEAVIEPVPRAGPCEGGRLAAGKGLGALLGAVFLEGDW